MSEGQPVQRKLDWSLFGAKHVQRYRETGGEVGYLWNDAPCCIVTTVRSNGEARDTPLIFGTEGDAVVLVASAGGAPEHPWWYRDLDRNPQVEVQVKAERWTGAARTANGEERTRLWAAMSQIWPDYDRYQSKTDRDIPVVVIERT
jgi:deazaflavin-dependent oxidoreductase (nitroreductase family)